MNNSDSKKKNCYICLWIYVFIRINLFGIIVRLIKLWNYFRYIIFKVESAYLSGILLALLASFLGTLFSIFNGMMVKSHNATVISFYELLFGLVFITLYILFTDGYDNTFFILSGSDWTYLIILASICTAYAFIASVHVMKWISPYTVMLTTNMEPVYGILLALLILGEKEYMSPAFYLGAIIILITVVINGIIKTRKKDWLFTNNILYICELLFK